MMDKSKQTSDAANSDVVQTSIGAREHKPASMAPATTVPAKGTSNKGK